MFVGDNPLRRRFDHIDKQCNSRSGSNHTSKKEFEMSNLEELNYCLGVESQRNLRGIEKHVPSL